jgi:rhamnulokinase
MMNPTHNLTMHAAIDLGASGGRVAIGTVRDGKLEVEILHRWHHAPLPVRGGLQWDILGIWSEVLTGLKLASARAIALGGRVGSVGADSWGVDFALLDEYGAVIDGVRAYRDPRTDSIFESAFEDVPRRDVFEVTGLQFMSINSLYQLLAVQQGTPSHLERARTLLMVPDLIHFWLSGRAVSERTDASTTQFYDPRHRDWARGLLEAFGLRTHFLPELMDAGSVIGPVLSQIALETGLEGVLVIAPGTHDTAAAVAATPLEHPDAAYISSGTWSLVGLEVSAPVITAASLEANLTNEAGIHDTTRLLKNVMGLWILQECRHAWTDPDWPEIYAAAEAAAPLTAFIDPNDARFLHTGHDMPERVQAYCRDTNQPVPESRGQIARCILESLALKYRSVLQMLERVTEKRVPLIHIVGGGSQVTLLNQMTADATGLEVVAGPTDATLTGNILMQAEAMGVLTHDRREIVRRSFELQRFAPKDSSAWDDAFEHFSRLTNSSAF